MQNGESAGTRTQDPRLKRARSRERFGTLFVPSEAWVERMRLSVSEVKKYIFSLFTAYAVTTLR